MKSIFQSLSEFKDVSVFIAGDIILDSYLQGVVSRVSPEAPVPIVLEKARTYIPGGAANTAANIASLGAKAVLCGRVGFDAEGEILTDSLKEKGVSVSFVIQSQNVSTITKTRVVSGSLSAYSFHQLIRIDKEEYVPLKENEEHQVIQAYKKFLSEETGKKVVVISDYLKGFLSHSLVQALIKISIENKVPVITDPKSIDVTKYFGSTIIKPNLSEARNFYHSLFPEAHFNSFEEELDTISEKYRSVSGSSHLIMTLAEKGAYVKTEGSRTPFLVPTEAIEVFDVSGAGDTFIALLALGVASQLSLEETVLVANRGAGLVCGKRGTATVSLDELLGSLYLYEKEHTKIVDLEALSFICKKLRAQKKKIVFTNGCFDIVHAGHVSYLKKAKQLGDILILGLNTDESIRKLKGDKRPIQCFLDRAEILAGLSCIDFVIGFGEDTPLDLIRAIAPDVLVKGEDYTISTTVGAQDVLARGGEVKHISFLDGRSTSKIIDKIVKAYS